MSEPHRTADASTNPCQVRASHNPTPIRTQSHHRFPVYLQMRLWGEVRLEDRWDACGTDHDSIHTWVSWLLGEHYSPALDPGIFVKAEAKRVIDWYNAEKAKLGRAFGAGPYGTGPMAGALAQPDAQWDGIE